MVTAKETMPTTMMTTTIGLTTLSKCVVLTACLQVQSQWTPMQTEPVTPSILTMMATVFLMSMMYTQRTALSGKISMATDLETMLTLYQLSTT